ncbi:MAG: hypothetical protein PHN51_06765 [Candidatus Nanopelagicales bacterium]|nr:hypothetical protein [Candidatus Nanopelagicales bacterium]
MIGSVLVLVTWALIAASCVAIGFGLVSVGRPVESKFVIARQALWWGFAVVVLAILVFGVFAPLRDASVAVAMGAVLVGFGAFSLFRYITGSWSTSAVDLKNSVFTKILFVALAVAVIYLAFAALGPVTNYDTGLYHLGAIKYAGDYSTIPGLANLYFPFGYNNSLFPVAAFLGNGPWDGEGYRLVNGLIISMMVLDLALRWIRGSRTVGAYVLLVGAVVTLVPMVALSDYWVTSPSSDAAVLALTMVATAYLSDVIWSEANRARNGATAFLIAVLLVSLRPLMGVFLVGVVGVLVVRYFITRRSQAKETRPKSTGSKTLWVTAAVIAALFAIVQSIRDFILSGWLQYPLSLHPFSVEWLAPDPVWNRTPTLGAARDPLHLWEAAAGWNWIPAWLSRLPSQWETYVCIALFITAIVTLMVAARSANVRWKAMLLVMLPSLLTCAAWFLASPPSFRFAWGPVFSLGVIPIGWALFAISRSSRQTRMLMHMTPAALCASSLAVFLVVGYCAIFRLDTNLDTEIKTWALGPISVELKTAPIVFAPTESQHLSSGLAVLTPSASDQCWNVYPLCTPQFSGSLALRGASIQEGFLP